MELRRIGIAVVYNNEPMEENIPYVGSPVTGGGLYDEQVWRDNGIDPRKAANQHLSGPKILSIIPSIVTNLNILDYFLILFPLDYVKGTIIPGTNWRLPGRDTHISDHGFINCLGVWLVMGCYKGIWSW